MRLLVVVVIAVLSLTGCDKVEKALACPEGQHSEFAYFIPIIHQDPFWIQEIPVYECVS